MPDRTTIGSGQHLTIGGTSSGALTRTAAFTLPIDGGQLALSFADVVFDAVSYNDTWPYSLGRPAQLDRNAYFDETRVRADWCCAAVAGGTPGGSNAVCTPGLAVCP